MRSTSGQQHLGAVLKLLSQMADLFLPGSCAAQPGWGHCPDITTDPDFWFILRCALVRAFYLLCCQAHNDKAPLHYLCATTY